MTSDRHRRNTAARDGAGGAGEQQTRGEAPDIVLPHQHEELVRHIAIDIGGSLIKLVYFSSGDTDSDAHGSDPDPESPRLPPASAGLPEDGERASDAGSKSAEPGGRLHFAKFETSRVEEAIAFIEQKQLHQAHGGGGGGTGVTLQVCRCLATTGFDHGSGCQAANCASCATRLCRFHFAAGSGASIV